MTSISGSGISATFVYDGDGKRVEAIVGGVTTVYIGNYYERDNGTTVRKYYYAGAVRVAMRAGSQTYYLLGDHPSASSEPALSLVEGTSLTSAAITLDSAGNRLNSNTELRYYPYGAARYDTLNQQPPARRRSRG